MDTQSHPGSRLLKTRLAVIRLAQSLIPYHANAVNIACEYVRVRMADLTEPDRKVLIDQYDRIEKEYEHTARGTPVLQQKFAAREEFVIKNRIREVGLWIDVQGALEEECARVIPGGEYGQKSTVIELTFKEMRKVIKLAKKKRKEAKKSAKYIIDDAVVEAGDSNSVENTSIAKEDEVPAMDDSSEGRPAPSKLSPIHELSGGRQEDEDEEQDFDVEEEAEHVVEEEEEAEAEQVQESEDDVEEVEPHDGVGEEEEEEEEEEEAEDVVIDAVLESDATATTPQKPFKFKPRPNRQYNESDLVGLDTTEITSSLPNTLMQDFYNTSFPLNETQQQELRSYFNLSNESKSIRRLLKSSVRSTHCSKTTPRYRVRRTNFYHATTIIASKAMEKGYYYLCLMQEAAFKTGYTNAWQLADFITQVGGRMLDV